MEAISISETKRPRYLLGLCSRAEREQIESEYFEDDDAFEEMLTAEDDLIDAYARDELTTEERLRFFEKTFVSSLRVQFARAFARAVSASPPIQIKIRGTSLDIFKTFQPLGVSRTVTILALILFVAVTAWLFVDRKRMNNELQELRAESAALSKRNEALRRRPDSEQTRTAAVAAQLADRRRPPYKPRHRQRETTPASPADQSKVAVGQAGTSTVTGIVTDPQGKVVAGASVTLTNTGTSTSRTITTNDVGKYSFEFVQPGDYRVEVEAQGFKKSVLNDIHALVAQSTSAEVNLEVGQVTESVMVSAGAADQLINRDDTTLGNTSVLKQITELPTKAGSVPALLTLRAATTREGNIACARADQSNVTLDGVDINKTQTNSVGANVQDDPSASNVPANNTVLRLNCEAIQEFRVTITTAADLSSGDYVLSLMAKKPDGSFIKVAEFFFKLIRDE